MWKMRLPRVRMLQLFLFVALATVIHLVTGQTKNGTYVAVAPQLIRPGSPFQVSVTILKPGRPVLVTASLRDASNTSIVENQTSISGDSTSIIVLQVPINLVQTSYKLFVSGTGDGVSFENSTSVDVKTKSLSCFVQTDKATYKPGQKVLFRVITVYPDLKPYTGKINVSISDNSGNKIAQWLNQNNDIGVFNGSLQLSDQPPLGTWSINVVSQGSTTSKSFYVQEYVLPKFEVALTLPPYFLVKLERRQLQEDLHFTLNARYTYGQPVKGRASISVSFVTYSYENSSAKLMNVELVDGSADVTVKFSDLLAIVPVNQYSYMSDLWQMLAYRQLLVVANVTETVSGIVLSGNGTVQCTSQKYSLSFLDITASNFKPGLTFKGYLQLKQYDGTAPLAEDIQSNKVLLTVTYNLETKDSNSSRMSYSSSVITVPLTVPASGYMAFPLNIDISCSSASLQATFNVTTTNTTISAYKPLSKFNSRDSEGIQISLSNSAGLIQAGQTASFIIKSSANISAFSYQFVSKAIIVRTQTVTASSSNIHSLNVVFDSQLAQQLAPSGRIVAWYITDLGEIVSDSLDFSVDGAFANQVSVSFDEKTVQPTSNVTVSVSAYQGSYVGLLAVDQSVLLLKSGNDVTQNTVLEDLATYDSGSSHRTPGPLFLAARRRKRMICLDCGDWHWWPYFTGGSNTAQVFDNAGLEVMTNAFLLASPRIYDGPIFALGAPGPGNIPRNGDAPRNPVITDSSTSSSSSSTTVRKNFPETWIWTEQTTGPDGKLSLKVTVPDTITSWVLSAFAVSPTVGLGIAPNNAQITVYKPFFISLDLPYSIVRGEEFELKVNVFNYMSSSVSAVVTLQRSDLFKVQISNSVVPQNIAVYKTVEIPAMDVATASFWIAADNIGQIPIEVKAVSQIAADAVSIPLLVKPEGIPQQYSASLYINLSPSQTYSNVLNVSLPSQGLVQGSVYIELNVVGDLLGQSINGLGNLLRMPYGCGEQNMLNFAPNVYILKYLQTTGQSVGSIKSDALQYINSGYQRELTYQRNDGSFSAFGNADPSGSVWLSAFVIKCFHEAKNFIPVEDSKIAVTLKWLLDGQSGNGSFFEPPQGRVIHTDMQGGSSKGVALTAYVLISLLENNDNSVVDKTLLTIGKTKALQYLESQLTQIASDPYALNIVCYALTLANSSQANTAFQSLNKLAITKDGLRYWHKDNPDDDAKDAFGPMVFRPPYYQAPSVDIEMTSYGLLTYVRRRDISNGIAVAKWLVAQRSAFGGFSSTQDTVMALQALAEFAALTVGGNGVQQLSITATADNLVHQFEKITSENSLLLQSVQIPSSAKQVFLNAAGSGVGLVQMNVKYNVEASVLAASSKVQLSVNTTNTSSNEISVKPCASWSGKSASGMAVIEINVPSGFTANDNGLVNNYIKRVDVKNDKLILYVDELSNSTICVQVNLSRANIVDNIQPAAVSAYLYYDPDQFNTVTYKLGSSGDKSVCTQCPSCCDGGLQGGTADSAVLTGSAHLFFSVLLASAAIWIR